MAGAIHGSAITLEGHQVGTVESIDMWSAPGNAGRVNVVVKAIFADFAADLDRYLIDKGYFQNRCSQRIYWVGDTAVLDAGAALRLAPRRYDSVSVSSLATTRLLRIRARSLDVTVPRAPVDRIVVPPRWRNCRLPGCGERTYGLRVREEIRFAAPRVGGATART